MIFANFLAQVLSFIAKWESTINLKNDFNERAIGHSDESVGSSGKRRNFSSKIDNEGNIMLFPFLPW